MLEANDSPRADDARDDVLLLKWPEQEKRRAELEREGRARVLLVRAGADPPESWTALEDWIRCPADPEDLYARVASLRGRVDQSMPIELQDGAIARRGSKWVSVPPVEMALLEVLVNHRGHVVSHTDLVLAARAVQDDATDDVGADHLNGAIHRLRGRLRTIGVQVHNIRRKGFLLELEEIA